MYLKINLTMKHNTVGVLLSEIAVIIFRYMAYLIVFGGKVFQVKDMLTSRCFSDLLFHDLFILLL